MKLYATVTSERASKGQGGNEYLDIAVTDDNEEQIARMRIYPKKDNIGEFTDVIIEFSEHLYVNGHHWLDDEVTGKGKKQKGEEIRCNNCMKLLHEDNLLIIEDMRACPQCKTDKYLMDL